VVRRMFAMPGASNLGKESLLSTTVHTSAACPEAIIDVLGAFRCLCVGPDLGNRTPKSRFTRPMVEPPGGFEPRTYALRVASRKSRV
jgi:hypothetical protein